MTVYCLLIHVLRFSFSSTRSLDRLFGYPLYPIPFTYYIALLFLGSFPSPTRLLTRGSFTHPPTLPYPTLPYLPLARSLTHSLTHSTTHQPTHLLSGSRTQSLGSSIRSRFQLFPVSSCFCVHLFASEAIMTLSSINEQITFFMHTSSFFSNIKTFCLRNGD